MTNLDRSYRNLRAPTELTERVLADYRSALEPQTNQWWLATPAVVGVLVLYVVLQQAGVQPESGIDPAEPVGMPADSAVYNGLAVPSVQQLSQRIASFARTQPKLTVRRPNLASLPRIRSPEGLNRLPTLPSIGRHGGEPNATR